MKMTVIVLIITCVINFVEPKKDIFNTDYKNKPGSSLTLKSSW